MSCGTESNVVVFLVKSLLSTWFFICFRSVFVSVLNKKGKGETGASPLLVAPLPQWPGRGGRMTSIDRKMEASEHAPAAVGDTVDIYYRYRRRPEGVGDVV